MMIRLVCINRVKLAFSTMMFFVCKKKREEKRKSNNNKNMEGGWRIASFFCHRRRVSFVLFNFHFVLFFFLLAIYIFSSLMLIWFSLWIFIYFLIIDYSEYLVCSYTRVKTRDDENSTDARHGTASNCNDLADSVRKHLVKIPLDFFSFFNFLLFFLQYTK